MDIHRKHIARFLLITCSFVLTATLMGVAAAWPQPAFASPNAHTTPTPTRTPTPTGTSLPTATPTPAGTPTPTPQPGPSGVWNIVSSPNTGWPNNYLYGVAGVASNDVWAVGTEGPNLGTTDWQVIEHWNGANWSVASSPALTTPNELLAVTAIASNDVWAVGGYDSGGQALTEHWNGAAWAIVSNPNPGVANRFLGVAAASSNNVWAVGYTSNGGVSQTLVEHWDGTSWSVIPSPNLGTGYNQLNSVTAVPGSANELWAAGAAGSETLVEHWNGTQWSIVSSPNTGTNPQLDGVAANSTSDVWAVGFTGGSNGRLTLTEHWNGSAWSVVSSPNPSSTQNQLLAVAALGANNVWAVGSAINTNPGVGVPQTLFLQWNGTSWVQVQGDNTVPAGLGPQPAAVGAIGASDIWSVGSDGSTLAEHWNGSSWSIASTPDAGMGQDVLNGAGASSSTDAWAVGYFTAGLEKRTLIEHWNGTQWSIVASPNSNLDLNVLKAVAAISSTNAWAVGYSENSNQDFRTTLVLHWDGTSWSVVSSPSPDPGTGTPVDALNSISVNSASDIWAAGDSTSSSIGTDQTLIEHWDGSAWNAVPSPNVSGTNSGLFAVAAFGTSDVWAVGYSGANFFSTLTEHWNGSTWSIVPSAGTGGSDILYAVSGTGTNDVWATGQSGTSPSFVTLVEHWNGSSWSVVPSVNQLLTDTDTLRGVAAISLGNVWAVGTDSTYPLIENWDGSKWSIFTSPQPSGGGALWAVKAITSCDIWAVGQTSATNVGTQTLTEHFACN